MRGQRDACLLQGDDYVPVEGIRECPSMRQSRVRAEGVRVAPSMVDCHPQHRAEGIRALVKTRVVDVEVVAAGVP